MAWNIGLLCIKADPTVVENETYLDIHYKSKERLHFEEITSVTTGSVLGVGHEGHARLRSAIYTPVAVGERLYNKFLDYMKVNAVIYYVACRTE